MQEIANSFTGHRPNLFASAVVAAATETKAEYIRKRAFDKHAVMTRRLAMEPTTPGDPWHTLLRESLEQADYRALPVETDGEGSVRVSEPSAVYDVAKMTQRRLFD